VHLWGKTPLPNPHQTCMQCPHTESVSTSTLSFSSLSSYFSVHSQNVLYKELTTFHRKNCVYLCSYDLFHILLSLWQTYGNMEYTCVYVCMYVLRTDVRVCVCTHTHTHTHTHTYVSSNSFHPVFRQAAHNYVRLKYTDGSHALNRWVFKS
jgi:hypothetical protein